MGVGGRLHVPASLSSGAPRAHWVGGWMDPGAGLDAVVGREFPVPAGTRTPDHPTRNVALYHRGFNMYTSQPVELKYLKSKMCHHLQGDPLWSLLHWTLPGIFFT